MTMEGWETAAAMLGGAGFPDVHRHILPHDRMNVWLVARQDRRPACHAVMARALEGSTLT
jgi:hypothetical protein